MIEITTMTALAQATYFPAASSTQPARLIFHWVHSTCSAIQTRLQARSRARRQLRADRALWDLALADTRVMNELSCALSRHGN